MEDLPRNAYKALTYPLKSQDSEVRWMLASLAVGDVIGVALVASIGYGGVLVYIGVWIVGGAMHLAIILRWIRGRYSTGGVMWFFVGYVGFLAVVGTLTLLSIWSAWPTLAPTARYIAVQSVGLIPLVAAIAFMSRKLAVTTV